MRRNLTQAKEEEPPKPKEIDLLDGKGVFTTDTVNQIERHSNHEELAQGKTIKHWMAIKFDNRYTFKTKDTILKLNETHKVPEKAIALSLAKKADEEYFDFDDGLMIQFETQKPKHVTYYCQTDNAKEAESCDLRLFRMQHDKQTYDSSKVGATTKRVLKTIS